MIRLPMPADHNDTTERFKRQKLECGLSEFEPTVPNPDWKDIVLLVTGAIGCVIGVVALVLRLTGRI